jgi:predicted acetyltransferase
MLRQALIVARDLGIENALLMADEANLASVSVIGRCGGVLERTHISEHYNFPISRFCIETKA